MPALSGGGASSAELNEERGRWDAFRKIYYGVGQEEAFGSEGERGYATWQASQPKVSYLISMVKGVERVVGVKGFIQRCFMGEGLLDEGKVAT